MIIFDEFQSETNNYCDHEIDMFINENDPEDHYIKDKIYEVFHFIMGLNLIFWTTIAIICTLLSY